MRAKVSFIADSLDNAFMFQRVLTDFEAEISAGSTLQIEKLLRPESKHDLVIFESRGAARTRLGEVESLVKDCGCPLLLIIDEPDVGRLRLPTFVPCDFVVHGASRSECAARVRRLLGEVVASAPANVIAIESMVINLDTYQVSISDEPVDFTYLEYALLAFLVQHPDRAYSREMLLQYVWDVEYYGGSRTVDVHVRRIRAKIGPCLAQRLETIRNVGYLWRSS